MVEVHKRTYIITGAAGGLGGASAERLLREGHNVLGVDISARRLEATAERLSGLSGRFEYIRSSLDSEEAGEEIVAKALELFGRVEGLANIAGGMHSFKPELMGQPVSSITLDYMRKTWALNVETAFVMCKAVDAHFTENGYGKIVNFTSLDAYGNDYQQGDLAYGTAKMAVIGMTKQLNLVYGPKGIRTNCIAPGMIVTDFTRQVQGDEFIERQRVFTTLGTFATAENIAETVAFLIGPESDGISGEIIRVSAGAR